MPQSRVITPCVEIFDIRDIKEIGELNSQDAVYIRSDVFNINCLPNGVEVVWSVFVCDMRYRNRNIKYLMINVDREGFEIKKLNKVRDGYRCVAYKVSNQWWPVIFIDDGIIYSCEMRNPDSTIDKVKVFLQKARYGVVPNFNTDNFSILRVVCSCDDVGNEFALNTSVCDDVKGVILDYIGRPMIFDCNTCKSVYMEFAVEADSICSTCNADISVDISYEGFIDNFQDPVNYGADDSHYPFDYWPTMIYSRFHFCGDDIYIPYAPWIRSPKYIGAVCQCIFNLCDCPSYVDECECDFLDIVSKLPYDILTKRPL